MPPKGLSRQLVMALEKMALKNIHPSIPYLYRLSYAGLQGGEWCPSPVTIGQQTGYMLDRSTIHRRTL